MIDINAAMTVVIVVKVNVNAFICWGALALFAEETQGNVKTVTVDRK